ncbi:hypothetical protein [Maribacter sp. 2307UL18-2]|uniref:hypothetical protein n=1 Tax=Maribacter sp. 2307UL18-2 TaxID=3386274 RepID=UPI0039BD142D
MNDNETPFKFIRNLGMTRKTLGQTLQKLNNILYGVVEAKPYELNWDEIIPLYNKLCGPKGDLDEFCHSHVTGYALLKGFAIDDALKEAMYLHLRAELKTKRLNGEL